MIKNESYKKLNQIDGEYLYEIVDYKDGKEKDSATKTEIDGVNEKQSYSKTGLGITSIFIPSIRKSIKTNSTRCR